MYVAILVWISHDMSGAIFAAGGCDAALGLFCLAFFGKLSRRDGRLGLQLLNGKPSHSEILDCFLLSYKVQAGLE